MRNPDTPQKRHRKGGCPLIVLKRKRLGGMPTKQAWKMV